MTEPVAASTPSAPSRAPLWLKVILWVAVLAAAASMLFRMHENPLELHAPAWVVWLVAAITVLAPAAVLISEREGKRARFWAAVLFSAISFLLCWVAFGPGERMFVGASSFSFAPLASRAPMTQTEGRIFFGILAIGFVIASAWMWKQWRSFDARPAIPERHEAAGGWRRKHYRHRSKGHKGLARH